LVALCLGACKHGSASGPENAAKSSQPASSTGVIRGVVSGPDGKPVSDCVVAAVPTDPKSKLGAEGRAQVVVKTGPDGAFTLAGLPPDTYGVTVTSDKLQALFVGGVVVAAGATVNQQLNLGTGGDLLKVHVQSDDGTPLSKLDMRITRESKDTGDVFYPVPHGNDQFIAYLSPGYTYDIAVEAEGRTADHFTFDPAAPMPVESRLWLPLEKQPPAPDEVVAWMKQHAVPLSTVEAGHGFDDLEPLKSWIGDAHVVAVGEATHGTREFFQLKHRMLEFLVERMGFTVFAIEASWPDTLAVNEYVLTGKGDPVQALKGLDFWIWDTEEVLALVQWMRAYNADPKHTHKVQFQGIDMQSPSVAIQRVEDYLAKADPALLKQIEKPLAVLAGEYEFEMLSEGRRPKAMAEAAETALDALEKGLVDHKAAQIKRTSEQAWNLAQHAAHVAVQSEYLRNHRDNDIVSENYRDRCMADNLLWLKTVGFPGAKIMVWAHNGHVVNSSIPPDPRKHMGQLLKSELGSDLFTFLFAFDRGSFQAVQMGMGSVDCTVGAAPSASLGGTLSRAGVPRLALPLRQLPAEGAVAAWFNKPHANRGIGSVFDPAYPETYWRREVLPLVSDAIFFIDETHAAKSFLKPSAHEKKEDLRAATNLDFEAGGGTPEAPVPGWESFLEGDYQAELATKGCHGGRQCVALSSAPSFVSGYGELYQSFAPGSWSGKRVTVRAALRAKLTSANGEAVLVLSARGKDSSSESSVYAETSVPSLGDAWRFEEMTVDIPAQATQITCAVVLQGQGTVWLDDVSLQEAAVASKPINASTTPPKP
jgi:erythromycin esterase